MPRETTPQRETAATAHRHSAATMHHSKLVAHLNHRWRNGGPSANLNSAGVIVHIPDGLGLRREGFVGNASRHGLPPPASALWANLGHSNRALPWGDRMSASVVSRKYPRYYIPANIKVLRETGYLHLPGLVLDASIASRLSCCYPVDADSVRVTCKFGGEQGCTPGCAFREYMALSREQAALGKRWSTGGGLFAHHPSSLAACLNGTIHNACAMRNHTSRATRLPHGACTFVQFS